MRLNSEKETTEAIAFSGGKESMKIVKIFKDKRPRPILATYLSKGDTEGLKPIFQYFAKQEGFEIKFLIGEEDGHQEIWTLEDLFDGKFYATSYSSNILKRVRKLRGIKVLYVGRKKVDLYDRGLVSKEKDIILSFKTKPKVVFPLWNEK